MDVKIHWEAPQLVSRRWERDTQKTHKKAKPRHMILFDVIDSTAKGPDESFRTLGFQDFMVWVLGFLRV